jgi:hypothetical protein
MLMAVTSSSRREVQSRYFVRVAVALGQIVFTSAQRDMLGIEFI